MAKKNSDARARFAHRLRAIRIPRGYKTARSFAEALEIDENRYTRYERAEVEPDLQLLMRICTLLGATPNDLLCDTIGVPPIDIEMPYGFSEQPAAGYQSRHGQPQMQAPMQVPGSADAASISNARRAIGFQLAELIAVTEARAEGVDTQAWKPLEKLRRTVPIVAEIEANAFQFIAELPERFKGTNVPTDDQEQLERLIQELIIAHKPASNDNN
jgi:transcriptional regulator with XRE-family HTH domain